jgi:hypothetical protein
MTSITRLNVSNYGAHRNRDGTDLSELETTSHF